MKSLLSIGVLALALVGCSAPVKVAWVGRPDVQARQVSSYSLITPNGPEPEAARLVRAALASHGFREAASGEAAQLILTIDSGSGPPQAMLASYGVTSSVSTVNGSDWPDSHSLVTSRNVGSNNSAPSVTSTGHVLASYRNGDNTRMVSTVLTDYDSLRSHPFRQYSSPSSYSSATGGPIFREQYLRIAAYDGWPATKEGAGSEIWSVRASVQAESDDIQKNLPMLASAVTDALAKKTRNEVKRAP